MTVLDSITVIVITKNEERNIERCLQSLSEFKNVLVLDSGSTDDTVNIARKQGANVVHQEWLGFGNQKQKAVELSCTDWFLSIDADEELTKDLLSNLKQLALDDPSTAYSFNRQSYFLEHKVNFCGWNPDWVVRLANRKYTTFTDDIIHEKLIGFSELKRLKGRLLHHTYQYQIDIDRKVSLYSELGKRSRKKHKNRYLAAAWSFFRTYFLKLGILDGIIGVKISSMNARVSWKKYS